VKNENGRSRLEKAISLERVEPAPVVINTCVFNMKQFGKRYIDCLVNPKEYVEAELECYRTFGYDGVWAISPMEAVGEALGSCMRFFEDDVPAVSRPVLGKPEDLSELLKENRDIKEHHRVRFLAEVVSELKKAAGNETMVFANVHSVFRLAGMLRGINNLYMDLALNPGFVNDLQEFCLPRCMDFAKEMVRAGADVVVFTNPIANSNCISRKMYEAQVYPYTKRLYGEVKRHVKVAFHACGQWDDRFDLLIEEGPHILWPDKVDIGWLAEKYGDKVCILGNVKTTETMLQGTPEQVRAEALECLGKIGKRGGYLLGADCALPRDVPADNVRALINAAREYSQAG
jgi:MtaA/CmuA family methyltransferase